MGFSRKRIKHVLDVPGGEARGKRGGGGNQAGKEGGNANHVNVGSRRSPYCIQTN